MKTKWLVLSVASLCSAVLFYASSVNAGQYYRWVDENGETHYSQQRPVDQKSQKIKTPDSPPPPVLEKSDKSSTNGAEADNPAQNRNVQIAKENCQKAKANINVYKNSKVILKDGKPHTLTEKERQELIKKSQEQVKLYCK